MHRCGASRSVEHVDLPQVSLEWDFKGLSMRSFLNKLDIPKKPVRARLETSVKEYRFDPCVEN